MLIARDYVGYMATEVVKRLVEGKLIETKVADTVAQRLRQRMMEEITVEDRLNEEVRQILTEHQDELRRTSVSYQEMQPCCSRRAWPAIASWFCGSTATTWQCIGWDLLRWHRAIVAVHMLNCSERLEGERPQCD